MYRYGTYLPTYRRHQEVYVFLRYSLGTGTVGIGLKFGAISKWLPGLCVVTRGNKKMLKFGQFFTQKIKRSNLRCTFWQKHRTKQYGTVWYVGIPALSVCFIQPRPLATIAVAATVHTYCICWLALSELNAYETAFLSITNFTSGRESVATWHTVPVRKVGNVGTYCIALGTYIPPPSKILGSDWDYFRYVKNVLIGPTPVTRASAQIKNQNLPVDTFSEGSLVMTFF